MYRIVNSVNLSEKGKCLKFAYNRILNKLDHNKKTFFFVVGLIVPVSCAHTDGERSVQCEFTMASY